MITKKFQSIFSKLNFFCQVYSYTWKKGGWGGRMHSKLEGIEDQVNHSGLNPHLF